MGHAVLGEILTDWSSYELDDSVYVRADGDPALDTVVSVLSFDATRGRSYQGERYLLGIEQIRDVVEGLEEQLGRYASVEERLRAALHYAKHDAFIEPESLLRALS